MRTLEPFPLNCLLAFALDVMSAACRVAASTRLSRLQRAIPPGRSAETDAENPTPDSACADLGSACSPSQSANRWTPLQQTMKSP